MITLQHAHIKSHLVSEAISILTQLTMVISRVPNTIQSGTTVYAVRGITSVLIFFLSCYVILTLQNEGGTITRIEAMLRSIHEEKARINSLTNTSSLIQNLECIKAKLAYAKTIHDLTTFVVEQSGNDPILAAPNAGSVSIDSNSIQQNAGYINEDTKLLEKDQQSGNEPTPITQSVEVLQVATIVSDEREYAGSEQFLDRQHDGTFREESTIEENPSIQNKTENYTHETIMDGTVIQLENEQNLSHQNEEHSSSAEQNATQEATKEEEGNASHEQSTSAAIIVSFRDLHETQKRSEHLRRFIPYMVDFLSKCNSSSFHIYVIEQSDDGRKFNRGKLMNIGFKYAKQQHHYDAYILHDVDLLPNDDLCPWYGMEPNETGVIHLAHAWGRYLGHPGFIGGVVSLSEAQFEVINGYPNNFWGWGGEDDEMSIRLNRTGIPVQYPTLGSYSDMESMDAGQKMDLLFSNRQWMNVEQQRLIKDQAIDDEWKRNGLSTLEYEVLSVASIHESGTATKVTVDVKLNGDHWTNGLSAVNYVY